MRFLVGQTAATRRPKCAISFKCGQVPLSARACGRTRDHHFGSFMHQKKRGRFRAQVGALGACLLGFSLGGCLYDSDQPCDAGMEVYGDGERCVCPAGTVYTPLGCEVCGDHEIATPTACVCEEGYARPTADAACVETPTGLGAACDPAASACPPAYDRCQPAGASGYCTTSGCTSNEDCEGGYACNADAICQRPPTGLGMSCTSPDDCAGMEATFCDTFVARSCQVQGCTLDPNDCFSGFECCDLSAFGLPQPLCIPAGTCMP